MRSPSQDKSSPTSPCDNSMNTRDIVQFLHHDIHTHRIFAGVYVRDELPARNILGRSIYVINTDRQSGSGVHWVAVYFDGKRRAEYFDSYGRPPLNVEIEHFILRNSDTYIYNTRLLQNFISAACGYYVIYFAQRKRRGIPLKSVLKPFHATNLWFNDRKVWTLIQQEIGRR